MKLKKDRCSLLKWSLVGLSFLLLTYFPFLLFQFQNEFFDFRNLILLFFERFSTIGQPKTTSSFPSLFFSFLSQQFGSLLAGFPVFGRTTLGIIIILLPFFHKKGRPFFWHLFFSLWLLGGLLVLTFLLAIAYPHHASFLWPLPFLLLISFFSFLAKISSKRVVLALGFLLIFLNVKNYFEVSLKTNDINQAEAITDSIIAEVQEQSFLLALLSSKSSSDGHLRYWLKIKEANVKSIDQPADLVILVCNQASCSTSRAIRNEEILDSECFPTCSPPEERKKINLQNWQLKTEKDLPNGQLYLFEKPVNP